MLLNTDLHTPNLKSEKKMQVQDFVNNLSGVDGGRDFDHKLLKQIYKGIKKQEFVSAVDHVVQIQALQNSIVNNQLPKMSRLFAAKACTGLDCCISLLSRLSSFLCIRTFL